jgi:hypothetical protein
MQILLNYNASIMYTHLHTNLLMGKAKFEFEFIIMLLDFVIIFEPNVHPQDSVAS